MHRDYVQMRDETQARLATIGFRMRSEDEFDCEFENESHWIVRFEGERYVRPAFQLSIIQPPEFGAKKAFVIRILMKLVASRYGEPQIVPSFVNQLDFILKYSSFLFSDPSAYIQEYDRLNKI